MLFKAVGKEENFFYAPLWLFDFIIDNLQRLADLTGLEAIENAAETGRIGEEDRQKGAFSEKIRARNDK